MLGTKKGHPQTLQMHMWALLPPFFLSAAMWSLNMIDIYKIGWRWPQENHQFEFPWYCKWGRCKSLSLHPTKGHCPRNGLYVGRAPCKQHLSPWNTFCGHVFFGCTRDFKWESHKTYILEFFYENNCLLVEHWQELQMFLPMTGILDALATLHSKIRHWNIWNVHSLQIGSS